MMLSEACLSFSVTDSEVHVSPLLINGGHLVALMAQLV